MPEERDFETVYEGLTTARIETLPPHKTALLVAKDGGVYAFGALYQHFYYELDLVNERRLGTKNKLHAPSNGPGISVLNLNNNWKILGATKKPVTEDSFPSLVARKLAKLGFEVNEDLLRRTTQPNNRVFARIPSSAIALIAPKK